MKKLLFCFALVLLCAELTAADDVRYGIIPKPRSLMEMPGEFRINRKTVVEYPAGSARAAEIAEDFCARLRLVSGMDIRAEEAAEGGMAIDNRITLRMEPGIEDEGYRLTVTPQRIGIRAASESGLYYGIQTICQLLPAQIYGEKKAAGVRWSVPCCEVDDAPRFPYRGLMLDAGRYFMPKELVLKFIDVMSMHKQNYFHWHLTEDQGWRIEIKKYPRLTEIGAWRKETAGYGKTGDGIPHGGFYTQDDVREVVEYARRRCVTVIPEIELPGHATAAIAAYPELSCFPDREYEVATTWGIKKDVFCPKAATFRFLEDVFTELFDLFPSPYYHIGGDECPRDRWKESPYVQDFMKIMGFDSEDQVQIFFVERMSKFLKEKGSKTIIGWDEILDGGAVPGTVVLSYRGHAPAMRAVNKGMYTILTPNRWCYIDYYQEDPDREEKSQGLFLPLEKVYNYFPIPDTLEQNKRKFILGQQGCLWTEFISNAPRAEYMAFPRAVAMSEVGWTDSPDKDWDSFRRRMPKEFERLGLKNVNYSRAFYNVIFHFDRNEEFPKEVGLTIDYPDAVIRYTTDGTEATAGSPVYSEPVTVQPGDVIRAQGFLPNGKKVGVPVEKQFVRKEQ